VREPDARPRKPRPPAIEILDPIAETGQWTWEAGDTGFEFRPSAGRRRT
jgi:hypothetical protein